MKARVFLFLATLLSGWSSVRAEPPMLKPDSRKPIVIPFELLDTGHMAIQVKLNGKGPFRMIFDTGAPSVLFSGKAAKESGAIPANAKPFLLGQYTAQVMPVAVRVGDFRVTGVVPSVADHPTVGDLASALGPLEGLVGFDLFVADKLTIDYQARTITILPPVELKPHDSENDQKRIVERMLGKPQVEYSAPGALWGLTVDKAEGDENPGVDVTSVREGSAAAEAGIEPGDRMLVLSRRWTESVEDVYRAAAFVWAGKAVKVILHRGNKELELTVKPRTGF